MEIGLFMVTLPSVVIFLNPNFESENLFWSLFLKN